MKSRIPTNTSGNGGGETAGRNGGFSRGFGILLRHGSESYRGWRNECLNRRTRSHIANLGKVILQHREGRRDWRSAGMINTQ